MKIDSRLCNVDFQFTINRSEPEGWVYYEEKESGGNRLVVNSPHNCLWISWQLGRHVFGIRNFSIIHLLNTPCLSYFSLQLPTRKIPCSPNLSTSCQASSEGGPVTWTLFSLGLLFIVVTVCCRPGGFRKLYDMWIM